MVEGVEKEIKKSEAKDNEVVRVVGEIKKAGVNVLRNNEWQIKDKLVSKKEGICSEGWDFEIGDYLATSQYAKSRI